MKFCGASGLFCLGTVVLQISLVATQPGVNSQNRRCSKLKPIENGSLSYVKRNGRKLARFSCKSGYTLYGVPNVACNGRTWVDAVPFCYAKRCDPLPLHDNLMYDVTPHGLVRSLRCYPGNRFEGSPTIFCDGQRWNDSAPTCKARFYDLPDTCTFENDKDCHWGQDPKDLFKWLKNTGPTHSVGTGPSEDHTGFPNGHYMYVETTRLANSYRKAALYSPMLRGDPEFPPGQLRCFIFWYHMHGQSTGNLSVLIRFDTKSLSEAVLVHRIEGPQGPDWHKFQGTLPITKLDYQIVLVSEPQLWIEGDTALDDLSIQPKCVRPGNDEVMDITAKIPPEFLLYPETTTIAPETTTASITTVAGLDPPTTSINPLNENEMVTPKQTVAVVDAMVSTTPAEAVTTETEKATPRTTSPPGLSTFPTISTTVPLTTTATTTTTTAVPAPESTVGPEEFTESNDSYADIIEDVLNPFSSEDNDSASANSTTSNSTEATGGPPIVSPSTPSATPQPTATSTATASSVSSTTNSGIYHHATTNADATEAIVTSVSATVRHPSTPETLPAPTLPPPSLPRQPPGPEGQKSQWPLLVGSLACVALITTAIIGVVCVVVVIRRNRGDSFRVLADSETDLVMDYMVPPTNPEGMVEPARSEPITCNNEVMSPHAKRLQPIAL